LPGSGDFTDRRSQAGKIFPVPQCSINRAKTFGQDARMNKVLAKRTGMKLVICERPERNSAKRENS
jgi:hypothetical protein